MLLSDILKNSSNDLEISNFKDINIEGIQSNSKLIKKNNIFFALNGKTTKGINFADDTIKSGAVAIVYPASEGYENKNIITIKSNDIMKTFGEFLNAFYPEKPSHMIGVTGTSGKTSVVEFVRQTIQKLGIDCASIGTLGVNFEGSHLKEDTLTQRETVDLYQKLNYLKKEKNIDYVAIEQTSQGLHQKRSTGIIFNVAAFTNISREHLDYHDSIEDYFAQKMKLFTEMTKKGSPVVLNADIPEFDSIKKICIEQGHKVLSYGYSGDLKIINIKTHNHGQYVDLQYLGNEYVMKTPFIGKFQVMNLLCALGIVVLLNIEKSIEKILEIMETIKQADGRMEFVAKKANGASIYIDFAHKPDALQKVLETMREHASQVEGSRIAILFGCGGERDKTKRPAMGKIAHDLADMVFITDDNPRSEDPATIRSEILAECPGAYNIDNRKKAIEFAIDKLEPNDILIIAGKGHEKYIITKEGMLDFDEFQIVKNHIKKLEK